MNELNLTIGAEETLVATVAPDDASNKAVTWESSDSTVATVDNNGKVTALAEGSTTITVTTTDGSKKNTCTVNVSKKTQVITAADQTAYVGTYLDIVASTNAAADGATLTYAIDGSAPAGVTLVGNRLTVAGTAVEGSVTINIDSDETTNYAAATQKQITVTISKKDDAGVTVKDSTPAVVETVTKTYGDSDFTLTASFAEGQGGTNGEWEWVADDSETIKIVGDDDKNAVTVKILKANADGATITAKYVSDTTIGTKTVTVKVNKADQTINANATQTFTYGDTNKFVSATITKGDGTLSYAVQNGTSVSVNASTGALTINGTGETTVKVTASETDNYNSAEKTITVTVTPKSVTAPTAATGLTYNAQERTGVAEGTGYTITNGKKTDAGSYTATATLKDGYKWSDGTTEPKKISWSIAPAYITTATAESQPYTGSTLTPVLTVKAGSLDATYDIGTWSGELKNFGTYTATVTGTDNFTGTKKVTFSITHDPHSAEHKEGKPATETEAGYREYYVCVCGGIFENEACTVQIVDFDAWKAEGGNGYIPPLKVEHNITYKGDEHVIFAKDLTKSAGEGEMVTFTFTIRPRYIVDTVTVKTANGDKVKVRSYNGVYSFVMPDEDVIVKVTSERKIISSEIVIKDDSNTNKGETNPDTGAPVETAPSVVLATVLAAGICFVCHKNKETE